LAAALAVAQGCSDGSSPLTAIAVTVTSDLSVPSEINRLTIDVTGVKMAKSAAVDLRQHPLPGSLTLVNDGQALGPITVTAAAWLGSRKVIEKAVHASFVRDQTTHLLIGLNTRSPGTGGTDGGMAGVTGMAGAGVSGMGGTSGRGGTGGRGGAAGIGGRAGRGGAGGMGGAGGTAGGTGGGPQMNLPPSCRITRPTANQALTTMLAVSLQGTCTDPETGTLTSGLLWSSDLDGALGSTPTVSVPSLSIGTHMLTLCATDPVDSQLMYCASVTVIVSNPDPPTATIASVTQASSSTQPFVASMPISFIGTSSGQLVTLSWRDSFVGDFATNAFPTLDSPDVVVGRHRVVFTVIDNVGQPATDSRTFVVLTPGQTQLVAPYPMVNTTLSGAVAALAVDSMSQVLVSNSTPAVYLFDGTSASTSATATQTLDNTTLHGNVATITAYESASLVYIGTDNGLAVCSYAAKTPIDKMTCSEFRGGGIPDNHINSVTRFTGTNNTEYLALGTSKGVFLPASLAGSTTGTEVLSGEDIAGTVASGGMLWIASRTSGLNRYDPATSTVTNRNNGAPALALQAIAVDSSGMIWVGSSNGFGRYDPGQQQWTVWRTGDPPDPKLISNVVHSLAVSRVTLAGEARDVIWIGTDAGVSRFDPSVPSFMSLTIADGLPSNNVFSIAVLPNGNKLFGTAAGVAVYAGP
jgi:hypothetical protein